MGKGHPGRLLFVGSMLTGFFLLTITTAAVVSRFVRETRTRRDSVRAITARPWTIAAVVVPEIASGSWWRDGLHNERSLYLEWLLRFEPRVVLSAAPLHRRL
jgi:hypothetical protein